MPSFIRRTILRYRYRKVRAECAALDIPLDEYTDEDLRVILPSYGFQLRYAVARLRRESAAIGFPLNHLTNDEIVDRIKRSSAIPQTGVCTKDNLRWIRAIAYGAV